MRRASGVLLALAVLTGCGGESSSERIRKAASATATPVTDVPDDDDDETIPLDLYRLRAGKLCDTAYLRANARLAPLRAKFREDPTVARAMKLNAAAVEFVEPLFEEMASLPPPKGREGEVRQLNRLGAATIRYLKRSVSAYEAGDVPAAKRALSVNRTAALAYAKATERLGLEGCGSQEVYPGR